MFLIYWMIGFYLFQISASGSLAGFLRRTSILAFICLRTDIPNHRLGKYRQYQQASIILHHGKVLSARPMPVRNAMRKIHAHRQEELQRRDEEREAEEFENEMEMTLGIEKHGTLGICLFSPPRGEMIQFD